MTLPSPRLSRQSTLRQQLITRFTLVVALTSTLVALAGLAGYRNLAKRSYTETADRTAAHLQQSFEAFKLERQEALEDIRSQIDFQRFTSEEPSRQQVRLHAYLTAQQGRSQRFDSILILRRDGSLHFGFGRYGRSLGQFPANALSAPWYFDPSTRSAYLVLRTELWLGDAGRGTLIALEPLDNGLLGRLAPAGAEILLIWQEKILARSQGLNGAKGSNGISGDGVRNQYPGPQEQRSLAVIPDAGGAPSIVMRQHFEPILGYDTLLLAVTAGFGMLALLLWVVLGRWLQRLTQRIGLLARTNDRFAAQQTVTPELHSMLQAIREAGNDEIQAVATASETLMHSVVARHEEHEAYAQTLEILEEGVVEIDTDGGYIHTSPGWHKLSGCKVDEAGAIYDCLHPDDVGNLREDLEALKRGETIQANGKSRLKRDGNEVAWVEYSFVPGTSGKDGPRTFRGVLRDVTERHLLEQRIKQMALHDTLTGLPNRVLLEDRSLIALRMAERHHQLVGFGFIDLDHFKQINDEFGHKTGDDLLVAVASTLRGALRTGDTLARWGGDEFVVLLPELGDSRGAREVAAKLAAACGGSLRLPDREVKVTFSMGFAIYPDDATNLEALMAQADRAMYVAKARGRNNVQFFADVADAST